MLKPCGAMACSSPSTARAARFISASAEPGDVPVGHRHQVPAVVGIPVQDEIAVGAPVHDVGGPIVTLWRLAEDTSLGLGAYDVRHPPRRPEVLHPPVRSVRSTRLSASLAAACSASFLLLPRP